ncbi:MAG: crotonobetainyl-CoA--carnitine CoA-transferase, partial [Dermabacter sp.]|nr:crotonobetainyl-CoA--carnitine CoA-transferase [Dermabacter sp.]
MIRHTLTALFPPHARESGEPPLGPHADHYEAWSGVLSFSRRPRQGALGDYWLMAPMLAIHALDPEF